MDPFTLTLPDQSQLTGLKYIPPKSSLPPSPFAVPLIICRHGGTYTAQYFDASPTYSLKPYASAHHIPLLSINRPSYAGTSPLPAPADDSDTLRDQGKHLHSVLLPAL